jgi:Fic family protein
MLLLVEQRMLPSPLLYLSAFFEATRDEYYRQLYNLSAKGTWGEWLIYFLNGVAVQSEDVLSRSVRINELLTQWKIAVASGGSGVPLDIVQHLAVNPYFTTNKIAQDLGIAYSTAQRGVGKLEDVGIIQKTNDNKRDKVYCATAILNILEEPTKIKGDVYE